MWVVLQDVIVRLFRPEPSTRFCDGTKGAVGAQGRPGEVWSTVTGREREAGLAHTRAPPAEDVSSGPPQTQMFRKIKLGQKPTEYFYYLSSRRKLAFHCTLLTST